MSRSSHGFDALCLELAARQWKSLGVAFSGAGAPTDAVIDPEALILFTATLGDADPRLREESIDWCVQYGARFISSSRLRTLRSRHFEARPRIDEYLATVNALASTRWPLESDRSTPLQVAPSGKSTLPSLRKRAALLRIQLRCLFGVTARSELLLVLASSPMLGHNHTASELTFVGYSKRNIATVLEDLARCELLTTKMSGNRIGYRLSSLTHLLGLAPTLQSASVERWDLRFSLLSEIRSMLERTADKKPIVQSTEARNLATKHAASIKALGLSAPDVIDPETYFDTFIQWASNTFAAAG